MNERIKQINGMAASCGCGCHYPIEIDPIRVEPRAIDHLGGNLKQKNVRRVLLVARGPSVPGALGLEAELIRRSLKEAHEVRSRYTLLRAINTLANPQA